MLPPATQLLTLSPPTFDNAPISRTIRSGTEPYEADDANQQLRHLWRRKDANASEGAVSHLGRTGGLATRHLIRNASGRIDRMCNRP